MHFTLFYGFFDARTRGKKAFAWQRNLPTNLLQLRNKQEASSGITEYRSLDAKDDTDQTD